MIGRAGQLGAVGALIERAQDGTAQTALIAGEAGIGKSRLVAEAKTLARARGFRVLEGNCFEQDRSLPYSAVLEVIRSCFTARPPVELADFLGPLASELVKVAPELSLMLPGIAASPALESEQEKRRLFYAMAQLIDAFAAQQSLLIVFEDLHWSDEATLQFLTYYAHYLARANQHAVLLLMTYRSDEVDQQLRHFIADLVRRRLTSEIALAPLTMAETDVMVRAICRLQRPVRRDVLETLYSRTEGNPFFIEEILNASVSAKAQLLGEGPDVPLVDALMIPGTVQDAVHRQASKLGSSASRLLDLAAVTGQRFDLTLLEELSGQSSSLLIDGMKELLAAQLVVEESADLFRFRHALTREAIYSQLLARERRAMHRAIGEALERRYAGVPDGLEGHIEELAYHFFEAESWEKAAEYSQQAGEKAQELFTPRACVEHLNRCFEACERLGRPKPRPLLRRRAQAHELLGDFEQALADLEEALAAVRTAGERSEEWEVLLDLGMLWASRDYAKTGDYYLQALDVAQSLGDQATIARSLNRVGNWKVNIDRSREALWYHEQALAAFEKADDKSGIADTLDLLGLTWLLGGDLKQCRDYYERAVGLFRELDNRHGLVSSLTVMMACSGVYHTDTLVPSATLAEAEVWAQDVLVVARDIGWRAAESFVLWNLGTVLSIRGEYGRALDATQQARTIAEEIGHVQWLCAAFMTFGAIYHDLLDFEQGRQDLEAALALAKETGSWLWIGIVAGLLGSCYVSQGRFSQARTVLDEALPPGTPAQTLGQRTAWAARIECALAQGQGEEALQMLALMTDVDHSSREGPSARLWKLRGDALVLADDPAAAETAYLTAREAAQRRGARGMLWRIHASLAALYRNTGRRPDAQAEAAAAHRLIDELAGAIPGPDLRQLFLAAARSRVPFAGGRSSHQTETGAFSELTAREREVAALVARGYSNRAMADALVLSERTVESHVANALSKLGFNARAQLAVWAVEHGLVADQ
jgi:tetratricopeptide (TPR) repeat protein